MPRLFGRREGAAEAATEQVLEVASVDRRGDGTGIFRMTNGQVWAQSDTLPARSIRPGTEVRICRATWDSFLMSPTRGGPGIRVERRQ